MPEFTIKSDSNEKRLSQIPEYEVWFMAGSKFPVFRDRNDNVIVVDGNSMLTVFAQHPKDIIVTRRLCGPIVIKFEEDHTK